MFNDKPEPSGDAKEGNILLKHKKVHSKDTRQ